MRCCRRTQAGGASRSAGAERTDDAADLRLDVTGVGSVYLGGFTFDDARARLASARS